MQKKGLLLISGLDSILAGKLLAEGGVLLEIVYFHIPFCTCLNKDSECKMKLKLEQITAEVFGSLLHVIGVGEEYLPVLKYPEYGYGKNMNPCIDCKIFMFKKAKEYMQEFDAAYLITGEVLGERPMSQNRKALDLIEEKAELSGLVLRPLSAKLMPLTYPEKEGWVERDKLLDIQGRSRKVQLNLAKEYNIRDYPAPAGGCLLTDPGFSRRLKDLMKYKPDFSLRDISLLKLGRHFRISDSLKLIVGRNEDENNKLEKLFNPDSDALLMPVNTPGPSVLAIGKGFEDNMLRLSGIAASYCKLNGMAEVEIEFIFKSGKSILKTKSRDRNVFENLKI